MKINDNTALKDEYKYHRVEIHQRKQKNLEKERLEKRKNAIIWTFLVIIGTVIFFLSIYTKVQVTALYSQVADEKSAVEILQSENVRMQTEIEANMSLKNVEAYAEDVLGLKKLDKSQITYIQIQNEDVVEVTQTESNIFVSIKNKLDDIVEYLFG